MVVRVEGLGFTRLEEDMAELLRVRQRLARMRGYETWAEYAQREGLRENEQRGGARQQGVPRSLGGVAFVRRSRLFRPRV